MGLRYIGSAALAVLLGACSTEPSANLRPGRYDYIFRASGPGLGEPTITGVLVIDDVTADSLVGRWDGGALDAELLLNSWNVDAYLVWGRSERGLHMHRVYPGAEPTCTGKFQPNGTLTTYPATCTLTYQE